MHMRCRSVNVDIQRHDVERPPLPPPPPSRSPSKLTNGSVPDNCVIYRPNNRVPAAQDRPRSVAAPRGNHSDAVPRSASNNVKRSSSVRGASISSPRLQSSTNQSVILPSRPSLSRPCANDEIQLMPTRTAPPPPYATVVESFNHNGKPADENPVRKAPSRPPLPAPSAIRREQEHNDEMHMRSPSNPPPAPPDSRHRFYSPPVALQRNVPETHANSQLGQRTVSLSTSPHRPGMSNSGRLPNSGLKQLAMPNGHTAESGVHGPAVEAGVGSSNSDRRQVSQLKPTSSVEKHHRPRVYRTGVNESQCWPSHRLFSSAITTHALHLPVLVMLFCVLECNVTLCFIYLQELDCGLNQQDVWHLGRCTNVPCFSLLICGSRSMNLQWLLVKLWYIVHGEELTVGLWPMGFTQVISSNHRYLKTK